ncbi:hypothetical protein MNBD_GAMMA12-2906 [hydrothermal vent metagenome]|uniref:Peptidase M48 domain-containing protein n=2 Tax=hydrothermal vent metagenome TaxID=652676 RepID=A0A3B0YBL0_9ZZZZ
MTSSEETTLTSPDQLYDQELCSLDLGLTVYDGDQDIIFELMQNETFSEIVQAVNEEGKDFNSRKSLLQTSLRLTPKMAPMIFNIAKRCTEALGLKREIEFYVYQDTTFNAACYPPSDDKIFIMVTSGMFEKFTETELEFVIGHELGHFLFNHNSYPIEHILERGHGHLSPVQAIKAYAWKRNAEVTADRVGLLCCRDFNAVAKAFFKLSSGVTVDHLAFQLDEYIDQFKDLEGEMGEDSVDPRDWYSTHPFSPLRIKALDFFQKSETYNRLIGQEGGSISEDDMEDTIKDFMSMMEPSYLQEDSEVGSKSQEFLFLGGWLISASNDEIEESEIESLKTLISEEVFNKMLPEVNEKNMDELYELIQPSTEALNMHLPLVSKLNMIEQLSIVTYADGSIDDCEIEVLYNLCRFLEIDPSFADQVLHNATQGMD